MSIQLSIAPVRARVVATLSAALFTRRSFAVIRGDVTAAFIRTAKLRSQVFQSVTSPAAATEKCCRLNICRALRQWLLRDYLFLHARARGGGATFVGSRVSTGVERTKGPRSGSSHAEPTFASVARRVREERYRNVAHKVTKRSSISLT